MEKIHSMKAFDEVFKDIKPFWIALAVWNAWAWNPENPDDRKRPFNIWHEWFVWDGNSLYSVYEDDWEAWEKWHSSCETKTEKQEPKQ
jgi:hypothetical protein